MSAFTGAVLDVGCYGHPDHQGASQNSVKRLVDRFQPEVLLGFDPNPEMPVYQRSTLGQTDVALIRAALWTRDGTVAFDPKPATPLAAAVTGDEWKWVGKQLVPCFDIAAAVTSLADGDAGTAPGPVVVKMDVEGAEYELIRRLLESGADLCVSLLLVEWHNLPEMALEREVLTELMGCPIEEWK